MTRVVATLVAVGALLGSGCRTDREVTRPDPKPVTEALLTDALLTADDVPGSYEVAEDAEPVGPEMVPEHDCDDDEVGDLDPKASATVTFTGAGLGTTLTNTLAYYPGRGDSVGREYRDLYEDCQQVVVAEGGLQFTTQALDFGVLSDDTLPILFTIEHDDGTIEERNLIVMRSGDLVSTIRLDGPRPSDLELLDAVTRVAIGNLGLLAEDT